MFESFYACTSARNSHQYSLVETNSDEDTVSKTKKEDIKNQEDMMQNALSFFRKVILPTKIAERNNTSVPSSK